MLPEVLSDIFQNRMFHTEAVDSALLFEADADADADAHIIVSIPGPMYATFASGRTTDNPLYVGGVKANVGHGEAVSYMKLEPHSKY